MPEEEASLAQPVSPGFGSSWQTYVPEIPNDSWASAYSRLSARDAPTPLLLLMGSLPLAAVHADAHISSPAAHAGEALSKRTHWSC
jgi:hypothetical protein